MFAKKPLPLHHFELIAILVSVIAVAVVVADDEVDAKSDLSIPEGVQSPPAVSNNARKECDPSKAFKYNSKSALWEVEPNDCGATWRNRDGILRVLKRKRVLFVGDSTVANEALAMLAMLCNPQHFSKCRNGLINPMSGDVDNNPFNCKNSTSENVCSTISWSLSAINNFTTDRFYKDRRERKMYWNMGLIPPIATASFEGAEVSLVTAGCHQKADGIVRVLRKLTAWVNETRRDPYDAVVISGGFHCTYNEFKHGWIRKAAREMNDSTPLLGPMLWLEPTHCFKKPEGNHFVMKKGRQLPNPIKTAACAYIDRQVGPMNGAISKYGFPISHTRSITELAFPPDNFAAGPNATELAAACGFVDFMHPSLKCYEALVQLLVIHLERLLRDRSGPQGQITRRDGPTSASSEVTVAPSPLKDSPQSSPTEVQLPSSGIALDPLMVVVIAGVLWIGYFTIHMCRRRNGSEHK